MSTGNPVKFLLASPQPAVLAAMEPALTGQGARVAVVLSAAAAMDAITGAHPPDLALLDAALCGAGAIQEPGMEMAQWLAAARAQAAGPRIPIVLISDKIAQSWLDRLAEGVIDDLLLTGDGAAYWQLRLHLVLRTHRLAHELEALRDAANCNAQLDRLTGVYNREALLSLLFRETDRVQRMSGSMSLVLFDVDDFGHWNSRLGIDACDELLCQVARRAARLLRSYDLLGRPGKDELLVALPGCGLDHAAAFAERLRLEVFAAPFRVAGETIRLSACFGIAPSHGRSPVVALREAEQALESARLAGPESIQCFGAPGEPAPAPVTFLSSSSGDELLAW